MSKNDLENENIQDGLKFTTKYFEEEYKDKKGIQILKCPPTSYSIFNFILNSDEHMKQVKWFMLI